MLSLKHPGHSKKVSSQQLDMGVRREPCESLAYGFGIQMEARGMDEVVQGVNFKKKEEST